MRTGHVFLAVEDEQFARPVQIAFAVRSAEAELAVGIEIARRNDDVVRRLDDEQIRLNFRIKIDPVSRAVRDDDVIVGLEGQHAEQAG